MREVKRHKLKLHPIGIGIVVGFYGCFWQGSPVPLFEEWLYGSPRETWIGLRVCREPAWVIIAL